MAELSKSILEKDNNYNYFFGLMPGFCNDSRRK